MRDCPRFFVLVLCKKSMTHLNSGDGLLRLHHARGLCRLPLAHLWILAEFERGCVEQWLKIGRGVTHQLRRAEVPRAEEHSLDENFGIGDDWKGKIEEP